MSSALSAPHFHNEEAAYAYVEARIRALARMESMSGQPEHWGTQAVR